MKPGVILSLLAAMLIWAVSYVWTKSALTSVEPCHLVLLRLTVSSVVFVPIALISHKLQPLERSDFKRFLLLALIEPFLYYLCEAHGLKRISTTFGAVIIATTPVFAAILAGLTGKEKVTLRLITAILLTCLGVALIAFDSQANLTASGTGIALMFCCVFASLSYTILLKSLADKYNPTSVTVYQNLFGLIYYLPAALVIEHNTDIIDISPNAWVNIILLAVFASTIAFVCYSYAVRVVGVTRACIWLNTIPIFTAVVAWLVLDEELDLQKIMGILAVIVGVALIQTTKMPHRRSNKPTAQPL